MSILSGCKKKIGCSQDKWLPPEFGRRLAAAVDGSGFHMMKKAGHSPHKKRPEMFNALRVCALGAT